MNNNNNHPLGWTTIEQIKAEIEWLINDKTDGKHVAEAYITAPKRSAYLDILNFINSLPTEEPSEYLEGLEDSIIEYLGHVPENEPEHSETLYTYEQMQEIARHFANWQKEQTINKACDWLRRCVDVDNEVKMIDGEPEALSFIEKAKHRIEVANQIVKDFKKAMEE